MATITPIMAVSANEAPCQTGPAAIEDIFLNLAQDLAGLTQAQDCLDDELPGSSRFHRLLRFVEITEERIGAALHAIRSLVPSTDAERHLRRVARDLQIALGIEDGEDALYFLDTLEAWPDILFLSDDVTGGVRANALVRFCLDQVAEHQRRCRHAMVTVRALPDPGPDGSAVAMTLH